MPGLRIGVSTDTAVPFVDKPRASALLAAISVHQPLSFLPFNLVSYALTNLLACPIGVGRVDSIEPASRAASAISGSSAIP